jgi:hypothetical protein
MLSPALRRPFWRFFPKIDVPIRDCVHYAGFRYGRGEYNPYETYLVERHAERPGAKRRFVEFLKYYRPRDLGEALDVQLSQPAPLWCFPWQTYLPGQRSMGRGWLPRARSIPDVITFFSDEGILAAHIDREFGWLERALARIRRDGYQPERFGFVHVITLRADTDAHLMLDGNHRVAAMAALGESTVRVVQIGIVRKDAAERWPAVRTDKVSRDDALAIFGAYFRRRERCSTTATPAAVIEG